MYHWNSQRVYIVWSWWWSIELGFEWWGSHYAHDFATPLKICLKFWLYHDLSFQWSRKWPLPCVLLFLSLICNFAFWSELKGYKTFHYAFQSQAIQKWNKHGGWKYDDLQNFFVYDVTWNPTQNQILCRITL